MRLVTFETPWRALRVGALTTNGQGVVDLNAAYSLYLKEHENEQAHQRLADARVPADMRALFEGGDASLNAARKGWLTKENVLNTRPRKEVEKFFAARR